MNQGAVRVGKTLLTRQPRDLKSIDTQVHQERPPVKQLLGFSAFIPTLLAGVVGMREQRHPNFSLLAIPLTLMTGAMIVAAVFIDQWE
jgi:hypothetical protein